jgi:short-subunit dehydrogenase|tara:strand:+ start:489 stop:1265 length:777 start_codon:yes stop_codon:yes gene_type:complete
MATFKVFITGASSGIGQSLAREYARQGATLGLVARRQELLLSLKNSLEVESTIYVADVRDEEALNKAAQHFILQHGVPDIVISNAGVSSGTLTENKTDTAIFKAVIDINLIGMVNTFQPFLSVMRKEKKGSLVGIASIAGIRGLPGAGAYSASKAAVIAYLESLRIELNPDGLTVTTIAPGYIKTPMTDLNGFSMPFLMAPEVAAKKFSKAIKKKKKFIIFPWQMRWAVIIMRVTPVWLWDLVMKNAPRKTRAQWDWL